MTDYIKVKLVPVRELFSGSSRFQLPWFQRAYAWQVPQVGRLLTDIFDVMEQQDPKRQRYFLGTLMVARTPGQLYASLVDGHQRVMTLTLLFAVIRDLETDPFVRSEIQSLIGTVANRLQPQENLAQFCVNYVQAVGATESIPDGTLSEAEQNIVDIRDYLRGELSDGDVSAEVRRNLLKTLTDQCSVIVQEVDDVDEAWRILQIDEETRYDFNATNRAKVSLLSMVPNEDRKACRLIWEDCEAKLPAEDLHKLLLYLRTLKLRRPSDRPLESDVAQAFAINTNGLDFMRDTLAPAAESLAALRRMEIGDASERAATTASIKRMLIVSDDLWVPAALHWLDRRGVGGETEEFFARLERLVWHLRLTGIDPPRQQRKIIALFPDIEKGVAVANMREFDVSAKTRNTLLTNLRGANFDGKKYATVLLRRCSLDLGHEHGRIDDKNVTLEHILPKSHVDGGPWQASFRTEQFVKDYAHRLGNLTFLNTIDNNAAASREWAFKRSIYARSEFIMSNQLSRTPNWTPEAINQRTEDLIAGLFRSWDMDMTSAPARSVTPRFG